jgi:uracil-DNA glycosylase
MTELKKRGIVSALSIRQKNSSIRAEEKKSSARAMHFATIEALLAAERGFRAGETARMLIVGQAPGARTYDWYTVDDPRGAPLRESMGGQDKLDTQKLG